MIVGGVWRDTSKMMVETILESSQDFGMSNGSLPQWKRELLQRRAARSRPPPPAPPAPPAPLSAAAPPTPPTADDDEELRYGPGIVKRLKSRYLSLALRDAPRRRPSVLRRAASLEHLLDAPPPPAPRPPPHLAPAPRSRDAVKRARSVDALSRLDDPPPAPRAPPAHTSTPAPAPRAPRPPRRPQPLLRDAERPPPDVVRAALRKFEAAPTRRAAPAARLPAVLRRATPEPEPSVPQAPPPPPAPPAAEDTAVRVVSRAALEGIARAGSSVRYAFPAPLAASHLPPAPSPARTPRRVGVIRPMPASPLDRSAPTESPPPPVDFDARERRDSPPSALVEPIPRAPPSDLPPPPHSPPCPPSPPPREESPQPLRAVPPPASPKPALSPKPDLPLKPELHMKPETPLKPDLPAKPDLLAKPDSIAKPDLILTEAKSVFDFSPKSNGTGKLENSVKSEPAPKIDPSPKLVETKPASKAAESKPLTNGHAEAERARWQSPPRAAPAWLERAGGRRAGGAALTPPAAPGAHSVVFNFVSRREVPDYVENDGVVLRAARRAAFKKNEPGVIVLENGSGPGAAAGGSDSEGEGEETDGARAASPVPVRFVNDNVLINGRSSMPARPNKDRITKLKLQFDESLTRTHEYPSEASFCEDSPAAERPVSPQNMEPHKPSAPLTPQTPLTAPGQHQPHLSQNTHMSSAALSGYSPHKTARDHFQLGVTRAPDAPPAAPPAAPPVAPPELEPVWGAAEAGDADVTRWRDARELPDLLF